MRILPAVDALTEPYWSGAQAERLMLQHCRECAACWHPPQPWCPRCMSPDAEWREASGRGRLYSYTVVHHPTHSALADEVPYVVAVVELDEGPHLVTGLRECDPGDIEMDMPLRVVFVDAGPQKLPFFAPDGR